MVGLALSGSSWSAGSPRRWAWKKRRPPDSCPAPVRCGRPGERGRRLTGLVERQKMIARRIAQRVEKPPAAARMAPAFGIHALGIGAHVQEFRPRLIVELPGLARPREVRLTAIAEFDF